MKHLRQSEIKPGELGRTVLTIGNFDGVHRGHQQILRRLRTVADKKGLPAVLIAFEPHPVTILNPQKGLRLIHPFSEREKLLARYGVDILVTADFDEELAKTPAEKWVTQVLVEQMQIDILIMGYDFSFGRGADGNANQLVQLGKTHDFQTEQIPALVIDGKAISSSRIRRLIEAGEVSLAMNLLGRPFHILGAVVPGEGRGKQLGFPTANLMVGSGSVPHIGVYGAVAEVGKKAYPAAVNVGHNPTFTSRGLQVEAHLLDFTGDLYGKEITIHFLRRWRDEIKYDSAVRLSGAITRDLDKTRQLFVDRSPEDWLQ